MALFSRIGRRGRRRRGRSAVADMRLSSLRTATCANYGVCLGAVDELSGSADDTLANAQSRPSAGYGYVYDIQVKNQPIPAAFLRTSPGIVANTGMYFKPRTATDTTPWTAFPSSMNVQERYRRLRWWSWRARRFVSYVSLLPGSTAAEATYRLSAFLFTPTSHPATLLSQLNAVNIMTNRTQYQIRDFRGTVAFATPINRFLSCNPTAPTVRGNWYLGYDVFAQSGYVKITIPGLDESVKIVLKMF